MTVAVPNVWKEPVSVLNMGLLELLISKPEEQASPQLIC